MTKQQINKIARIWAASAVSCVAEDFWQFNIGLNEDELEVLETRLMKIARGLLKDDEQTWPTLEMTIKSVLNKK